MMPAYETILSERRGDVLVITLNRPDRLNAAPPAMFDEIGAVLADLGGARAVRYKGEVLPHIPFPPRFLP